MTSTAELRDMIKNEELVMGSDLVLKKVKKGELAKVMVASNCPQEKLGELEHLQSIKTFELEHLELSNEALGTACKKPFAIAVVGVKA